MSARNAFHTTKGEEQEQFYGLNVGGGLIQNKASFFLRVNGNSACDTPNSSIAGTTGTRIETLKQRVPRENMFLNAAFDWAATRDRRFDSATTATGSSTKTRASAECDEPQRAFISRNDTNTFRAQEVGPLGRRFFINSRLNVGWTDFERESAVEAPTVRIIDAQTSGGAQKAGGRHSRDVNFASDLDYVRGIHSVRLAPRSTSTGIGRTSLRITWAPTPSRISKPSRRDVRADYAGASAFRMSAIRTCRPRCTCRTISASSGSLSVTPGVRLEKQTHMHGVTAGPRIGATWAPFRDGKTTLRASWGIFYDWLATSTYEQRFVSTVFSNARSTSPIRRAESTGRCRRIGPADRYLLNPALEHAKNSRVSGGVDYAFSPRMRVNAISTVRGLGLLRGQNLNAPVNQVRPDPLFGNVIEVVGDGRTRQHLWVFGGQTNPPQEQGRASRKWDFRRFNFFGNYTVAWNENNVDGPFSVPATGSLDAEWGTAAGHAKHRFFGGFFSNAFRELAMQINVNGNLGTASRHSDRVRRQRRPDLQRQACRRRRNTLVTTPSWMLSMFISARLRSVRRFSCRPGSVRPWSGRHADGDHRHPSRPGALPDVGEYLHQQSDQSRESDGIQRSADVAVLPAANLRPGARRVQVSTNLQF